MMKIRLYYNYFLVCLGIRKILPSYFINRIKIKDNGEKLVKYQGKFVRERVAILLHKANANLPDGYSIKLLCGFRTLEEQEQLRIQYNDNRYVAKNSGHATGGAVDITLQYNKKLVDFGTQYLDCSLKSSTFEKNLTQKAKKNRMLLYKVMKEVGFVNYPAEWWHYSYGDQLYSAYKRKKVAIYGKIERNL